MTFISLKLKLFSLLSGQLSTPLMVSPKSDQLLSTKVSLSSMLRKHAGCFVFTLRLALSKTGKKKTEHKL